ncbi:MAG: tetratricopeptide repeat protein [Thermodesulfobacteriota bacterium]
MGHISQRKLTFQQLNAHGETVFPSSRSGLLTVIFTLSLFFTVVNFGTRPITDGDIWFHLSYGKYIVKNHTLVVDHQAFTWTPAGKDIPYATWLAQIFFYLCYQIGGLSLLFVFRYAVYILHLFFLIRYARTRMIIDQPMTWFIILLSLTITICASNIKPNLFSCLYMTVLVFLWFQLKTASIRERGRCYILPVLMLVWVNTHGGWIFGYTYLICVCIGELLNIFTSPDKTLQPVIQKHFFISFALCSIALFVTPHGWKYPAYILAELLDKPGIQNHLNVIMEYQSLFQIMGINAGARRAAISYLLYFLISVVIIMVLLWTQLKSRAPDWTIVLPMLLFSGLYLTFIRTMFLHAPVFAFSSFYLISSVRFSPVLSRWKRVMAHRLPLILFVGVLLSVNIMNGERFSGLRLGFGTLCPLPVEESGFIKEHYSGRDIGNDDNSGSYLSWVLWPEIKTMIDARYFPFKDWYGQYLKFIDGVDVEAFLQKHPCDLWCLEIGSGVIPYFVNSSDWELIFYGPSCCIFVKKGSQSVDARDRSVAKTINEVSEHRHFRRLFDFTVMIKDYDTAQSLIEDTNIIRHNLKLKSELYAILGRSAYNEKAKDKTIEFCLKAIKEHPANIYALMTAGICYHSRGDLLSAEKYYRRVLEVDPDCHQARTLLENITAGGKIQ